MPIGLPIWFFIRYALIGALGGVLQTGTLYVWVHLFNLKEHYLWGAVVGFCVALSATFILQKYWTFRDATTETTARQFSAYTLIALCNLGLTVLLLHSSKILLESRGIDFFHFWYLCAQVASIAICAGLSFIANYFITFRRV